MLKTLIITLALIGLINGAITALTSGTPRPTVASVLVSCTIHGC
jgi:hypothetical protein